METARRITFNFLNLAISEIIAKIIQLVIFVYLARVFGKTEFGNFGFALAFSTIIVIIADFGLSSLLIREISRNKQHVNRYVSNAILLKVLFSILTFIIAYAYLNLMHYSAEIKIVTYLFVVFMGLQSFTDLFYSVFRAFEQMHYDSFIKILRMIILSILVLAALAFNRNLAFTTLMFPITEAIVLLISLIIYSKKFAKLVWQIDIVMIKELMKKSYFFFLSLIFTSTLVYINTVILQRIRGSSEVGIYTAAYNLLIGLTFVPLMYSNAVYPVFSRYFIKSRPLLRFALRKSYQYMLILGLPIAIGLFVYADDLISIIYGIEYADSVIALKILCWFVLLRFINIIPGTALSSIDKQSSRVFSQGVVATTNVLLNLILIPKYGFVGAGIATIASESLFILLYSYFVIKNGLELGPPKTFIKPLVASLVMAFLIINTKNIFLGTLLGTISYFGVLLLTKTFSKEDKRLLMRVLRNN